MIIFFGSIPRFFLNDLRPRGQQDALGKDIEPLDQPRCNIILGIVAYLISTAFFSIATANLLLQVGNPISDAKSKRAQEDSVLIYTIALLQIGYPIVSFTQVIWLRFSKNMNPDFKNLRMPGDQMDQLLSTLKDLAYGSLDTTTKGGLAVFCAFRAARS